MWWSALTLCPLIWWQGKGLQTKLHLRVSGQGPKHHARVRIGITFQKKFGREGTFVGTLVGYDAIEDLYSIQYEDEDVEELTWTDLNRLLRTSGDSITAPGGSPPRVCGVTNTHVSYGGFGFPKKNNVV
jgi:hypothetical protein